jgi:hypothetical protein
VILSMKIESMAHLNPLILCPQDVSDFEHENRVNGSSRPRDSVSSVGE